MATECLELKSGTSEPQHQEDATNVAKQKRKRKSKSFATAQYTIRDPSWAYLRLKHHKEASSSSTSDTTLDETTVSMFVDAALGQFLGIHGKAIPMDILKLDDEHVWARIPNLDRCAFTAALSSWIGRNGDALRVVGWSSWDANAVGQDAGQSLFHD